MKENSVNLSRAYFDEETPMKTFRLSAAVLILTASSLAQIPTQPPPQHARDLAGTSWQLVRFKSMDDTVLKPEGKAVYTLSFEPNGHLSAQIDCNRGMGSWSTAGPSQIRLGPLALTRAMCPPSALNNRLPRDLEHIRSYVFRDGHLFLALKIDSGIYEFEPLSAGSSAASAAAPPLENTQWNLTQIGSKPITGADPQHTPYILLSSAGHNVSGFAGCNRIIGGYQLEGNKLKFPHLGASMMACIAGMDTEQAFLKALNQVATWKITGDQLELFDPSGKTLATLQATAKP